MGVDARTGGSVLINGTGTIRELIRPETMPLARGTLILVPVLNILGFDRHERYLPDRRDLNRVFPGTSKGSLASRMARAIFEQIVGRADLGIDLHTAALRRTNFPCVRADMNNPRVAELARAFGAEVIMHGLGPAKSLRREAVAAGCAVIVLEAGEVWKVEPSVVRHAVRGVRNLLGHLDMIDAPSIEPPYQVVIRKTKWIRAERGGFLQFHVAPGQIVRAGNALATNTDLLGQTQNVLDAPFDAVVLGMTTIPATSPGEPICHLGELTDEYQDVVAAREALDADSLHERVRGDLATSLLITEGGH